MLSRKYIFHLAIMLTTKLWPFHLIREPSGLNKHLDTIKRIIMINKSVT